MTDFARDLTVDLLIAAATDERGFLASRVLPDGRIAAVTPLTLARARLIVGRPADMDAGFHADGW